MHGGGGIVVDAHLDRRICRRAQYARDDGDGAGARHLMRIGGARYQTGVAWADDLDMRPGGVETTEAPAGHAAMDADDRKADAAGVFLDLRGRTRRAVDDAAVVQQFVVMRVASIDEGDARVGEGAGDAIAIGGEVAGIGVHEHQRHLIGRLGPRELFGQPVAVVHGYAEVGAARPCRYDVEEQAAIARDRLRLRAVGGGDGGVVMGKIAGFEIMVARNDPPRRLERGQRGHHPRILVGRAVVGVVTGDEDEVDPLDDAIDLIDDGLQPAEALPVVGLVERKAGDREAAENEEAGAIAEGLRDPPADRGRQAGADALYGHYRALADVDAPRTFEQAGDEARHRHALQPCTDAVERLHGPDAPILDDRASEKPAERQRRKRIQQDEPIAAPRRDLHRDDAGRDHHRLRDDDRGRGEQRRISLARANDRQRIQRQHPAIAEVEAGERQCQDQHRLVAHQDLEAFGLAAVLPFVALFQATCRLMVDRPFGDREDGDDREHAKGGR
ncbi:hypothetical protein WR25_16206 [Diploscapter pachys]|uniref:Uncharacterized protein n=1 Tax=Diploscapter pachys TaxID=2018661 RepID=A0A2A2JWH9_9BILA|nr:hypothetical protein WR25_16206 [Diploscapter pachys]